ncbi:MAG: DUF4339 domain-containing protein [Chlamydiales bacterium]|nr:DUF4339 domain-containing protein [Chlamydiales bacterium]
MAPIHLSIALSVCVGTLSAYLAFRQGRNPYLWFCIGTFFGLIGVFALFIAPPKRKPQPTPPSTLPAIPEQVIIGPSDKFWYYLNEAHEQLGPMSFQALNRAWKQGTITIKTFVWHEQLSDWKPLEECIETKMPSTPTHTIYHK